MTSSYLKIGALLALVIGAFLAGYRYASMSEAVAKAEQEKLIQKAVQAKDERILSALERVSNATSTIIQPTKEIVRQTTLYRNRACDHDQRVFDALNSLLRDAPSGDPGLPEGSGGTGGQVSGNIDGEVP